MRPPPEHDSPSRRRGPALRDADAALALRPDGGIRIAVVADTHSRPHPRCAGVLEALAPDAILHAGDIGARPVLTALSRLAPTLAVRGNIDERAADLPDRLCIELRQGERCVLRILLTHIAVSGPRLRADVAQHARARDASLVICGHSHIPFIGQDRGLTIFNPGSVGPRRFHLPIVLGLVTIAAGRLDLRHIDCETGEPWRPVPTLG